MECHTMQDTMRSYRGISWLAVWGCVCLLGCCGCVEPVAPGVMYTPIARLSPSDGSVYQGFGGVVAISEGSAVVVSQATGCASVFDLASMKKTAELAPEGAKHHRGLWHMSVAGQQIAMTAYSVRSASVVYMFDLGTGKQTAMLDVDGLTARALFGASLCSKGDRVIVGASLDKTNGSIGAAYMFSVKEKRQTLRLVCDGSKLGDGFGCAVALSDTFAVVAAPWAEVSGTKSAGAVYVFDLATGKCIRSLTAPNAASGEAFGFSVAAFGDTIVIGAPGIPPDAKESGTAYVYSARTGQLLARLKSSDASGGGQFGMAVDIAEGLVVVGAPHIMNYEGNKTGAAYGFDPSSGRELARFSCKDLRPGAAFGLSLAIGKDWVLVGAPFGDDTKMPTTDAVYVFKRPKLPVRGR